MKKIIIGFVLGSLIVVVTWLLMPVLSIHFIALPILSLLMGLAFVLLGVSTSEETKRASGIIRMGASLAIIAVIYIIVASIGSSAPFSWESKQAMLNIKEVKSFDESVPNVDMDNLIILDESDALKASEKLLTEKDPSMGSVFQIGEGTLSVVNAKPYWIFPLEYRGFMKWLSHQGEIPGYLKVSATNFNDSQFVDYIFKTSTSGYFGDNVHRRIYTQYKNYGLTDYSFEVDDAGKGWWVVTAYTHKDWISTIDVAGTIIVDPVTDDMRFYKVNEQPQWVDRVFPMDVFDEYLGWYGEYINGWWNPSDQGKLQDTEGKGYVFKNGNLYFYTGLTSVGRDAATTGFVIFNPRTGETEYNRISGSIEQKAMGLMEELVQNSGYTSNYPYLININGEATYFSTLKGNSGNIVGYAFASVKNYKAVAWGKTLREAQTNYSRALIREGGANTLTEQSNTMRELKGIVSRVGVLDEGFYILKLKGQAPLFVVNSEQFPTISLTQAGDTIAVSYLTTEETSKIDAMSFVNESIE